MDKQFCPTGVNKKIKTVFQSVELNFSAASGLLRCSIFCLRRIHRVSFFLDCSVLSLKAFQSIQVNAGKPL